MMSSTKQEPKQPGRPKELAADVENVHLKLTPEEQLVLQVIRMRRKKRGHSRPNNSQIVVDALWKWLVEEEKVPREFITRLSEIDISKSEAKSNVSEFPDRTKR